MDWSELFKHFIQEAFMIVQGEYYDPFICGEEDRVESEINIRFLLPTQLQLLHWIGAHSFDSLFTVVQENVNRSLCFFGIL